MNQMFLLLHFLWLGVLLFFSIVTGDIALQIFVSDNLNIFVW